MLEDIPAPLLTNKSILVAVHHSCVSIGTEIASMAAVADPLYKRAIKNPQKVRRAFKMLREHGLKSTYRRIRQSQESGQPTGYSAAGIVVGVGRDVQGFELGDRVACSGAGIANHAEVICVPVNLATHVPKVLDLQQASTVTLGAIALQGIRRASPTLGETFVVIGLGILGQLVVQILKANGCHVLGIDPDPARIEIALSCGMDQGIHPRNEEVLGQITRATGGLGGDAVIITAASQSHEIIRQAMQACRKKGRVVLVGDVGLNLNREDFYRKELDFLVSTSSGPGRYDPSYEEDGIDYPIAFVRWTENRNMAAYLELLATQRVNLEKLAPFVSDLSDVENLYSTLTSGSERPLLAILKYPKALEASFKSSICLRKAPVGHSGRIRVAVLGTGDFAKATHLPNFMKLRNKFDIRWIVSRTGFVAKSVAEQYGAEFAGTDFRHVLDDREVDLCLISTRHNLHAEMSLLALQAGKHVLVEKPLALNEEELEAIKLFYADGDGEKPILMTGFNRRFSPAINHIRGVLAATKGPKMISYRMNAGYLPPDHWVNGPEGGGRNIGEACHIYDLFNSLVGRSKPVAVKASSVTGGKSADPRENFVATLTYDDGSVCSLLYSSLGAEAYPKESMEIFTGGLVITMEGFKDVTIHGGNHRGWSSRASQKGHFEELDALASTISKGVSWPISLEDQLSATRTSFEVEDQF